VGDDELGDGGVFFFSFMGEEAAKTLARIVAVSFVRRCLPGFVGGGRGSFFFFSSFFFFLKR